MTAMQAPPLRRASLSRVLYSVLVVRVEVVAIQRSQTLLRDGVDLIPSLSARRDQQRKGRQ